MKSIEVKPALELSHLTNVFLRYSMGTSDNIASL